VALAHEEASLQDSLKQGFFHPLFGADHLAAMVAVGLLSAVLLRGSIWRLPLAFVGALLLGGIVGFNSLELIGTELWIMGSLVAMGAALWTRMQIGLRWALFAVAFFGFAHGNAHGLELPVTASAPEYAAGFVLASILCHLAGVGLGFTVARSRWSANLLRVGGALLVGEGALLLISA
jgi:urease accessory protein